MKIYNFLQNTLLCSCILSVCSTDAGASTSSSSLESEKEPKIPRFSIEYMDQSVDPAKDFYQYANGNWVLKNPVPPDKSIWSSFGELDERNEYLLHSILESAVQKKDTEIKSAERLVGDFYAAAMDTERLQQLRFSPIKNELAAIAKINNQVDLWRVLALFHKNGQPGIFDTDTQPDDKDSSIYAFRLSQGGLSLPDRDYYLKEEFQSQREAYVSHIEKMFMLLGESAKDAANHAQTVMNMETELAKASRSRVDLRDPIKNYNKINKEELISRYPASSWQLYLFYRDIAELPYAIVGQPEFFATVDHLVTSRSIDDWKVYLRWHVLHDAAPYLHQEVETENFNFFGKILTGKQVQQARWKRAKNIIDGAIGEALGQLYVERYFPKEAKEKMNDLVNNLRAVFRDHLQTLDWMHDATRQKAIAKFDRFTQKIGYPEKFRDYSSIEIKRDDYLGNIVRAVAFEIDRRTKRIGKSVDKTEWEMTPPTVNAYFNPQMNEIVFPAGILQPPFFDHTMDDAVNYGAIAVVIGHEITHGYDDEGRHYNADGILSDWWTKQDEHEFNLRAQKIVDEYNQFEVLPNLHVNGQLTLGENIADLGGISIAYDAMQRAFRKDPSKRKIIDGLTPEQRFFISYAQVWRTNVRDEEIKRRITTDPHAPGRFRAFGPLMHYQEFYDAFGIKAGSPMWLAKERRAKIW